VPRPIVHRMLHAVMPLVRREPYKNGEVRVSERYGWLLDPVVRMCERLLPEAGATPDEVLSEAVEALCRNAFWHSEIHVDTKELSAALADTKLTRHFFWRFVERGIEGLRTKGVAFDGYWQLRGDHPLWHLKQSDLEWLIEDARAFAQSMSRIVRYGFINGLPGFVTIEPGDTLQTTALAIEGGKIIGIYVVRNPDKLRHIAGHDVH
jgi:hypothetical protein